jgi:Tfp pilus assembly protein PilO
MRVRVFVVSVILVIVPAMAQGPQQRGPMHMRGTMAKRAEIRVIPMAQFNEDKAAIEKMTALMAQLRQNRDAIRKPDAAVERQLALEAELLGLLAPHVKRASSDEGKSPTALAVQAKLNAMEGQRMCGACHGMGGVPMPANAGK